MTSDLNIFLNLTLHLSAFVFSAGLLIRTVLGHMNFWPVFFLVEIMKMTCQLNLAVLNVSCLLQFSVIMNFDWVHRYGDKVSPSNCIKAPQLKHPTFLLQKIVTVSVILSGIQVLVMVVDYILVYKHTHIV